MSDPDTPKPTPWIEVNAAEANTIMGGLDALMKAGGIGLEVGPGIIKLAERFQTHRDSQENP